MKPTFSIGDFIKMYPDEDACLKTIFGMRYGNLECCPACAVINSRFYKVKKRRCFECGQCGHQIYPLAGTIMEGTQIKLTLWFYAIFLFSNCRNGVSAKELQRVLGISYPSAWKLGHKIRLLMKQSNEKKLCGEVEIDESLFGPKGKGKRGWGAAKKVCLFGLVQRGGPVRTIIVPDRKQKTLLPLILANIRKGSRIYSDEFKVYKILKATGYRHMNVVHSKYQWREGHCHTNTKEGHWSNLKKMTFGTFTWISSKYLQCYIDEFDFRYNNRDGADVFEKLLETIANRPQ